MSNLFLVTLKVFVYFGTGSVSVLADAINNLTDSMSSFITLIGAKMSNLPADSEHPYGHGRMEYIAGLVVSALVLFAGFEFIRASIGKIINPSSVSYTNLSIAIMFVSCVVKFFMSLFYKKVGTKINSYPILAQSKDSISDVFVTGVVIISIFVYKITGYLVDGWAGLLVSFFILYQGYDLIKETISAIIGRTNPEEMVEVEKIVMSYSEIIDVHDIMIVDFGPEKVYAWMDVELDDKMSIIEAHNIIDKIEREIYETKGYHASIHLDPVGSYSEVETKIISKLNKLIEEDKRFYSFHDLSLNGDEISVDIVVDGKLVKTDRDEAGVKNIVLEILGEEGLRKVVKIDRVFKEEF
ncbi:Ferrous-iron efflux pump FieF [Peptoniphilus indolicus]|uniref:CDF family cation diffusion facilitator n=2 Tax=Peptoniphilus indolicus TaxID=33030 RepID=G4D2P6_9FIRM|nr:CDF family cation diffusion facilitator [Peptoniphilus indolicus ATCC 29427]SUB75241.1 Ferrous-iron efflux pump FieF [Peptoniphilus indolicus]